MYGKSLNLKVAKSCSGKVIAKNSNLKVKKSFLHFHSHITDCLIGSPFTNKNLGHKLPGFSHISHFCQFDWGDIAF